MRHIRSHVGFAGHANRKKSQKLCQTDHVSRGGTALPAEIPKGLQLRLRCKFISGTSRKCLKNDMPPDNSTARPSVGTCATTR